MNFWETATQLSGFNETLVDELNSKKAKWQIHAYGNVGHAFTNPEANQKESGLFYDQYADEHSWNEMKNFFSKLYS